MSNLLKVILVSLTEMFDSSIPKLFFEKWVNFKSMTYQILDKITDKICYIILYLFIIKSKIFTKNELYFVTVLLLYRILGTYLFIKNKDRKYLFYFPNFYLEIVIGLFAIKHFSFLKKYKLLIIIIILLFKIVSEYFHHYNSNILKRLLKTFLKTFNEDKRKISKDIKALSL